MLKPKIRLKNIIRKLSVLLFFISVITFRQIVSADIKEHTADEYRDKGFEAQQEGNFNEALSYYKKAVSLGFDDAATLNELGILNEQFGYLIESEKNYLRAIKADKNYLQAYFNLAYLYKRTGYPKLAFKYFKKYYEMSSLSDPRSIKAKTEMLNIYPNYYQWIIEREAKILEKELSEKIKIFSRYTNKAVKSTDKKVNF